MWRYGGISLDVLLVRRRGDKELWRVEAGRRRVDVKVAPMEFWSARGGLQASGRALQACKR